MPPEVKHILSSPLTRRMLGFGLLLLLSVGAALALVLWHDRSVRYDHGRQRAEAIAVGVERNLQRELIYLERVLAGLASDVQELSDTVPQRSAELLKARIAGIERRNPNLRNIRFSASLPDEPGLRATGSSVADSVGHLRIGHPRRVEGLGWVLPLALQIPKGAAREPAWVAASLRIDVLERMAADLDLGDDGIANIMHRDGWMVVRSRDQARWVGAPLQDTVLFREQLPRQHAGVFDLHSPLDGVIRIAAYRVLPEYPLLVVTAIARNGALLGWNRFALTATVLGGLLALLWLALLWVLLRARAREGQLHESLRQNSQQLKEARRIAGLGDWQWELDTGLVTWSEEIYRMQGLAPQPGPFHIDDIPQRIHPDDSERRKQQVAELVAGDVPAEIQYRILRTDGAVRTIRARGEWSDRTPGQRVLRGIQQDVTELAEARELLRQAQDEYRFLFQHNPMPMWVYDRETLAFLEVNDAMLANYGYSREELLAGTTLDIRPAEDAATVAAAARLPSSARPPGRVWTHLRKDGSRLRAAIHTHDIEFEGRPARLVLAIDVTEQERTEQRFQLIARATSDAVWDWDLATNVTWRSDNVYPLFGYAPGEFGPSLTEWGELLHPEDRARVMASMQHCIDSGASEWEEHYRFRRKDGSYAQVHDRGFLLRDEHGRAIRAVGGMLDVSEKQQHETDLRLLRRAVESTDNGIVIADARLPDMPVVYVNAAFERITGYAASEILGRNCRILQGEDRAQSGVTAIRHALHQVQEVRTLLRNYHKEGEMFWNDFHLAPVRDEAGTLSHFVGVLNDVTERQRAEEQLAHRATHDELTGLPNRELLMDRLQQALFNAERYQRSLGLAFIDLDNFKLINDSFGHGVGDIALRTVSERLQQVVRETDTVGRFGGDEFVVVLTEQTVDDGMTRVIGRMMSVLNEPVLIAGVEHVLTPSIGYCRYPQAGQDAETLMMRADMAMYQAKQQGRNRAVAYRPEFDGMVSQRLILVPQLRDALLRDEFVLAYQPVFEPSGRVGALEALVRWQHPERGLLQPGQFIGVCEESGLIVDLGRWILREAARCHGLLRAAGLGHVRIAVNVSAPQFLHDLYADVAAAMTEHDMPPNVLELELTESVIMDSPERAIEVMERLSLLGVTISVDDFGTGYSSMAYLKRLPIHRLKIDRSFVQDLGSDAGDAAICTAIIGLAHSLGLGTVAEGVETAEQLEWLWASGCDEIQGFLLGRPQSFETLLPILLGEGTQAPA